MNPKRLVADQHGMHGTIQLADTQGKVSPWRRRTRRALIVVLSLALAIFAAIAAGIIADNTDAGRAWLIKYGFEYPGDCGG
jgi:hypothetical protein